MLSLRPVTTASQNWRLLIVSASRPIPPSCFPTNFLSGLGPLTSLPWPPPSCPLAFTGRFYSSRFLPSRFRPSLPRSSQLHTSLPPEPPETTFAYPEKLSRRDAQTAPPATRATMSSDSEDDMPLSRFNGRGKCLRGHTRRRRLQRQQRRRGWRVIPVSRIPTLAQGRLEAFLVVKASVLANLRPSSNRIGLHEIKAAG